MFFFFKNIIYLKIVSELPDAPSDARVVGVNSTSAELEWNLGFNGNSPLDHVLVTYMIPAEESGKLKMNISFLVAETI